MLVKSNVKEFRKLFNYTQFELSYLVGCECITIFRIENEKCLPSVYIALRLAQVFHCSVHDLFYIV